MMRLTMSCSSRSLQRQDAVKVQFTVNSVCCCAHSSCPVCAIRKWLLLVLVMQWPHASPDHAQPGGALQGLHEKKACCTMIQSIARCTAQHRVFQHSTAQNNQQCKPPTTSLCSSSAHVTREMPLSLMPSLLAAKWRICIEGSRVFFFVRFKFL